MEQRYYSKQMDGDSNLVDDLSTTQTMMTRPSSHNGWDYVTDRPCLTQHTLASLEVADSDCLECCPPPHTHTQHFLLLQKPVRDWRGGGGYVQSGKCTLLRTKRDSLRPWKLK